MVPAKTTVNSEYYAHLIRVQLQRAIRDKRPDLARSGFILHQDNAPVHVSQPVKSTLQELGIKKLYFTHLIVRTWQYVTSSFFQKLKICCVE